MKPTDLRIDNLVDVINRSGNVHLPTGITLRVLAIGITEGMFLPNEIPTHQATADVIMTIPLRDLTPIELTEDWLKRLGCIEQRINSTKKNYWNKEKDFSVDVEFSFSGNLYYYNVSKDRRKPLIHVHKLQNLHYELKDEELKIK